MNHLTLLFIIWAALTACFAILMVYRAHLTQYETDQLFLSESAHHEQAENEEVLRRVKMIRPLVFLVGGADGLVTLAIIGMFVADVFTAIR